MNTIYRSILILGVGLISMSALAQDDNLTREVLLERDYNPTLNEATKINTAPNIFSPRIQSATGVKFLDGTPELTLGATKLGQVASGDIRTGVPFSQQRFYLKGGGGSHGNIDGAVGVRIVDTKADKLDISATHTSTNGNIDYAHSKNLLNKVKAKYADTKAKLKYQHSFEPSVLTLEGYYQNMGYNYYGNPFSPKSTLDNIDLNTKQKIDIISFGAGLKSSEGNEGALKYEANLSYTNFKSKYGFMPTIDKEPKGGIIDANVNFYTALGQGNIGIAGSIMNQAFSGKNNYKSFGFFGGLTNVTANPYYKLEDTAWDLTLGANLSYVDDVKSKFVITPNIVGQVHMNEVNTLYAGVTGGVNNNTFLDILQENRYASPMSRVGYSKTTFDINAGFKSGVISNLEFEIFGGYKQTKDDHLYTALSIVDVVGSAAMWSNLSSPIYDDVSTGHAGLLLKTKLIPVTTLTAKGVGYFYDVKGQDKALGKPNFTAELTADIKPIDRLTLSLSYLLMGGRKGMVSYGELTEKVLSVEHSAEAISMKDINEFNAYAEFEVVKWLSVHARVNNIFNQKYEQQLGYTLQGMNFLGGVSLKF